MEIEYDGIYEIRARKYPFYIREFTPLQYTRLGPLAGKKVHKTIKFMQQPVPPA